MRRVRIKPSKEISIISVVSGLAMVGLGAFWAIPKFGAFGVAWTTCALAITGYHAFNIFSGSGAATHEIDLEGGSSTSVVQNNTASRLENLESLRARRLITEEEYQAKRADIVRRL